MSEWKRFTEPPPNLQRVLVYTIDDRMFDAHCADDVWYETNNEQTMDFDSVLFWTELPELPKTNPQS